MLNKRYDSLVIGGGFYGCTVALELAGKMSRVGLIDMNSDLLQQASYANQARIHQGYHYPRSLLTAFRSRINFDRFVQDFNECVYSEFEQCYAIGKIASKVNAEQFRLFCQRIGAPIRKASSNLMALFDPNLIEDVFLVREYAFDAVKLKNIVRTALEDAGVDVLLDHQVLRVSSNNEAITVDMKGPEGTEHVDSKYVYNCTYAQINQILRASNLSPIPLKHELTEMALVQMPDQLKNLGITVMDGPFFSIMPFPARKLHTLSHVRYTPHHYWHNDSGENHIDSYRYLANSKPPSHYPHMYKDAVRYIPALKECSYVSSLWEIKTVLPQSEIDDSRPILFKRAGQMPNLITIMGGKIDNVYDIQDKLSELLDTELGM